MIHKLQKNFRQLGLMFVATIFTLLAVAPSVSAFSQSDLDTIYNDTVWYVGNSSSSSSCSGSSTTSASSLPADVLAAITKLQPDYEKASQATGVPWQVLAAIHFRENNNNPNGDLQAGNPIGGPFSQSSDAYAKYGYPKTIEESAEIAAKELIDKTKGAGILNLPVNVPSPDAEGLKDALFSYNGRASAYAQQASDLGFDPQKQPYEGSPYVMNEFDEIHKDMKIITKDNSNSLDGTDTRFGAYTIYVKLGGATGGTGNCTNAQGAAAIVQTALKYAWPDFTPPVYLKKKPEYQAAITAALAAGQYTGPTGEPYLGVDCGAFVTRVMIDSGADPGYNYGGKLSNNPPAGNTTQQQKYLEEQVAAGKYIKLSVSGTKDLQPGDIAINSEHTYIYVGTQPGFNGNSASASFSSSGSSWRSPMADTAYFSNSAGPFSWYRLKGS